jgi:prolyl-tRNA synthetase
VHTPKAGSIDAVSKLLKTSPERFLKSLVYVAGGTTVLAVVRGDHEVNEIKLARALGVAEVHLASAPTWRRRPARVSGSPAPSASLVGC